MNSPVELAQIIEGWATLAILITAWVAGALAFLQIRANRVITRESSAYKVFEDYMLLAFKNPRYSRPDWEIIQNDPQTKERYSWYVGSMLWACDEILTSTPQTESWRNTIRSHVRRHKEFLMTSDFRMEDYTHHSAKLRKVIDEVCANH